MTTTKQTKLALYVRVSKVAGREAKGDRYISPTEQIAAATARATRAGYDVQVFDADSKGQGISGAMPFEERPDFAKVLEAVESGKLAGIVVSAQDRLVRYDRKNGDMLRDLQERVRKAGAILLIADAPAAEVLDPEKELPTGYEALPTDVRGLVDRAVREEATKRWAAARRAAVARGVHICRVPPTGYLKNEKEPKVSGEARRGMTPEERWADPVKGQLLPGDPVAWQAMRRIFDLRAKKPRASWSECCRALEDVRVPGASGKPFWTISAVRRLVSNPVYKGVAYHGNFRNPEAHQPLVDELTWKRAQSDEPGKQTRGSEGALLGGILRCSCCGRKLTPSVTRYRCRPRIIAGPPCEHPASAKAADIELYVVRAFIDAIAHRPAAPTPPDLTPFEDAVLGAKAALEKWRAAAEAGTVEPEEFGSAIAARKLELEAAEAALYEAREKAGLLDEQLTLIERWPTMTVPERRRALQAFEVVAYVERGRQPVDERVTIELRGSPVGPGWEPDLEYDDPSEEELARRIAAVHAINTDPDAAATAAAWDAKYADAKIIIKPLVLSEEDKALEEETFGPLERALRKREREAKATT